MKRFFQRHIAIPQDHGAWVFLFSPLLVGIFAGKTFNAASLALVVAATAAFLIRQPLTVAVKAYAGRRPKSDLPAARFWLIIYGVIGLASAAELAVLGYSMLAWLAVPAIPVFAWHLWLVSRREERRKPIVEIAGSGALALTAPAALWVSSGSYEPSGWLLWVLCWLQGSASILYAYMRLEQRAWKVIPESKILLKTASVPLVFTIFNLLFASGLAFSGVVPAWLPVAFCIQLFETIWGAARPAIQVKPTLIGIRQLIVSTIFTLVFILVYLFQG